MQTVLAMVYWSKIMLLLMVCMYMTSTTRNITSVRNVGRRFIKIHKNFTAVWSAVCQRTNWTLIVVSQVS